MDKWLLSKLNTAIGQVDKHLEHYRIPEAARVLDNFVDEMSNWYVRRSRERFWARGMEQDKINAYMTLYTALVDICKCAAPMVPFMAEEIYRNLVCSIDKNAPESIHLCDFPTVNEAFIDKELEDYMEEVLRIVVLGRAARNEANIKNRQPIGEMIVKAERELPAFYRDIVRDELNVKEVTFTDDVSSYTSYSFKPQLRTLGPKYGRQLGGIRTYLANVDGLSAMAAVTSFKEGGTLDFEVDGVKISLAEEDLLIEMSRKEGFVAQADKDVTVVLDTNLTTELLEEGFSAEVISKIQTMRKDAGFEVMDHISVSVTGNNKIADIVRKNASAISEKVLADEILYAEALAGAKAWKVNGEEVEIGVQKR